MNIISDPLIDYVQNIKHELRLQGVKCLRYEKIQCPLCNNRKLSLQQVRNHIRSPTHITKLREYRNTLIN